MFLSPRKVFYDSQEDVSRTQVVTTLIHHNQRAEEDWRGPIRERWQRGRVVWTVSRFQSRNQGVASLLPGGIFQRGKGATFTSFSSYIIDLWYVLTRVPYVEFLSRSSSVEATQTPEPSTIDWSNQIFGYPDDGIRVDGKRYNHGFRHHIPRDQSTEAGKLLPKS